MDLSLASSCRYALKHAEWVVGNDCGLTHIASALGTKTIALFGATSLIKNKPLGSVIRPDFKMPETQVFCADMPCAPCQYEKWESVCQYAECMQIVEPRDVAKCISGEWYNTRFPVDFELPEQKQTLAAVIRVKDAIDTIEECLTAASRICDYFCIVDNGSTDGTLDYLRGFAARNPEKFVRQKKDSFSHIEDSFWCWDSIIGTADYDEPRDRRVMDTLCSKTLLQHGASS